MKKLLSTLAICSMFALIVPTAGGITTTITEPTIAPLTVTGCPVVVTECAVVETECPETVTECVQKMTECPETVTECIQIETECPETVTECIQKMTECPETVTECIQIVTECPETVTECIQKPTECPATVTECVPKPTECPAYITECIQDPTYCPMDDCGGEGCTPGYWKQPHHADSWIATGYAPDDMFCDIFECPILLDTTLIEVLWQGGGGIKALGRHTVAALLNAASPDVSYDLDQAAVINMFNGAYPEGPYNPTKDVLENFNEQGCPLN